MTPDTLRRLQTMRGLTRVGSVHTVLAGLQSDLQAVIEAVLELAGHDDEHGRPTEEPVAGAQVTDQTGVIWQRFEDGWRWWKGRGWSRQSHTWDYVQYKFGPVRRTTDDDRLWAGLPVRDEDASPAPEDAAESDAQPEEVSVDPETENGPENGAQGALAPLVADRERAAAARALRKAANAIARETVTCEAAAEDWLRDRAGELEAGEDRG